MRRWKCLFSDSPICHCQDCNSTWRLISRRKNKNDIVIVVLLWCLSSVHVKNLLAAWAFGTVLWRRRSSWFVSVNQRSLGDSWSSLSTEKNTDEMQIPDTESQIPLINCYLISFLSTSFRSAVVVCLITHAISASLQMLVNQCSQWRRWITLYSDGPVNVSQAFQGRGSLIKLCREGDT